MATRVSRKKAVDTALRASNVEAVDQVDWYTDSEKRHLYESLEKLLRWEEPDRDDADVKSEKEYVFGKQPYQFLGSLHVPDRDRLLQGGPRRRRLCGDPEYRSIRPGPTYGGFVPTMADLDGRLYRCDRDPDDVYAIAPCRLYCKRPKTVSKRLEQMVNVTECNVAEGEKLHLVHLTHGRMQRRDARCPGHDVTIQYVQIYPGAATYFGTFRDDASRTIETALLHCVGRK